MRIASIVITGVVIAALVLMPFVALSGAAAQDATPTTTFSCETAAPASPMAGMEGMAMGTPAAMDDHDMAGKSVEFGQMYIDMMIPHHASIIAMAQAAQDRLTDERLQDIVDNVISSQQAEIEALRGFREHWYGSAEPMPMDEGMMAEMMPGMGAMDQMALLMDPAALVATFCAAGDPDLAFIELTIPHHEMAIAASEAALDQATHDELREVAERVIADQQRENDTLSAIRQELSGASTPAP